MLEIEAEINQLMNRVRQDSNDLDAFKQLARVFHKIGKFDSAQGICKELLRMHPADPEFIALANDLSLVVQDVPWSQKILAEYTLHPERFRKNRQLVLSTLQNVDPIQDIDLAWKIGGEYLDDNLLDEELQNILWQLEKKHFENLIQNSKAIHTRFRPRKFKVTCIVSTYSSAEFIDDCMSDLISQSIFNDMEILIIDACSPENEAELIRPYLDKYDNIRYYITPHRIGIYPAWTMGCIMASAPYITPFSTNDRLLPSAYHTLSSALDRNPQASLVYGDSYLTDMPHQQIGFHSPSPVCNGTYRWPDITFGWLLMSCGVGPQPMWKKSAHDVIGYFDRRYKATGDQDFFLRHASHKGLLHVPEMIGMAWITPDSLSGHPSAHIETFNIQLKHFKSVAALLSPTDRLRIWQSFQQQFATLVKVLPQKGCQAEVTQLVRRHMDFFKDPPHA